MPISPLGCFLRGSRTRGAEFACKNSERIWSGSVSRLDFRDAGDREGNWLARTTDFTEMGFDRLQSLGEIAELVGSLENRVLGLLTRISVAKQIFSSFCFVNLLYLKTNYFLWLSIVISIYIDCTS